MGFDLNTVKKEATRRPHKILIYAAGGYGKTSLAAQFPNPIFLTTKGENGLAKLISEGQLPPVARIEDDQGHTPAKWADVLSVVRALRTQPHEYRYLVVDTGNGLETMLQQSVCDDRFRGDWGEAGFMSFHRGYKIAGHEWRQFLMDELEPLNVERDIGIIILAHSQVTDFKNPMGKDYSQYSPNLHKDVVNETYQWADMVWFGDYKVSSDYADDKDKKAVASGGKSRWLFTSGRPAYYAKSRVGVPDEIKMGDNAAESYKLLCAALKGASNGHQS